MNEILRKAMQNAVAANYPSQQPVAADDTSSQPLATSPTTFGQVPIATTAVVNLQPLSSKACKLRVSINSIALRARDTVETENYAAGSVYKDLFKGTENPLRKVVNMYRRVAQHITDNTVPWDKGERMAKMDGFIELTAEYRKLIAEADTARNELTHRWPAVLSDEVYRLERIAIEQGKPHIGDASMLPTVDDVRAMGIDVAMDLIPSPDGLDDPRLGSTGEEIAAYHARLDAKAKAGGDYCTKTMVDVLQKTATRLEVPAKDVAKHRTEIITNLADVASRMERANICDDPAIQNNIDAVNQLSQKWDGNDAISHTQRDRDACKADVDALIAKMAGRV